MQFGNNPAVYNEFLDIMKEFKSQRYAGSLSALPPQSDGNNSYQPAILSDYCSSSPFDVLGIREIGKKLRHDVIDSITLIMPSAMTKK